MWVESHPVSAATVGCGCGCVAVAVAVAATLTAERCCGQEAMTDARKTALLERFAPALVEDRAAAAAAAAKLGGAPSQLTRLTCLVGSTCSCMAA